MKVHLLRRNAVDLRFGLRQKRKCPLGNLLRVRRNPCPLDQRANLRPVPPMRMSGCMSVPVLVLVVVIVPMFVPMFRG